MYEGYYESDDQDGEYTQNSYIEGKSLINYKRRVDYGTLINNANIQETFTDDGYINYKQLGTGATGRGFRGNGFAKNIDQSKNYTIILRVRKNTFPVDVFVPFTLCHRDCGVKFDETVKGDYWGISYNISGRQTGVWKAVVIGSRYNVSASDRYWGSIHSFLVDENSEVTDLTQRTDIVGCEIEYAIEVLQGDYFDIDTGIDEHFEGVGSVKSPMIISKEEPNNLFYMRDWTSTLNGGTAYSKDGKIHFSGNFKGYTHFDIINGGESKNNIYLEAGTYYFKTHYKSLSPAPSQGTTISIEVIMADGTYYDVGGAYTFTGSHYDNTISVVKTCASPIVQIKLKIWYGGDRSGIYIDGISISKVTNDYTDSKYSVVSTPSDLELYCNHYYDRNAKTSHPCYQDTLDLTTGTVTRKNIKVRLNDHIAKYGSVEGGLATVGGGDMVRVKYNHMNSSSGVFPVQVDGEVTGLSVTGIALNASQGGYDGAWFTTSDIEHAYTNTNTIFMYFNPSRFNGIDYTNSATIKNWLIEQDFTLIIKIHNTSVYTEQLSTPLNPLKSYYNGSITTSSQHLAPTLKTTLPISNKFTTTNLTSGATYNVYFDGTATKLDAGGTVITNPVSPCEVECGGTTLTIEGTDIQNVRVIETTVKNEVGSVVGTTDVELSGVITSDLEVITNGIEFSSASVTNGNTNTVDNKLGTINTKGGHSWGAGSFTSNKTYPKGFSLLHIEFDVNMPSNNLMAIINFNNNVSNTYYNFRDLTLDNDTATIAQGQTSGTGITYSSIVTKGHFSRLVYCFSSQGKINLNINTGSSAMITASGNNAEGSTSGYTACANNGITISNFKIKVIENYPDATVSSQVTSSLRTDNGLTVIWQDMDMSIGQSISDLEQPIKLRSLGTTYDSYNPVTGELIKRIGVSETDGSYSVLSSPIVENIGMGIPITNLITNTFPITGFTNFSGNFKPNTTYTVFLDIGAVNGETASGFVNNSGAGGWGSSQYSYTVGKQVFTTTTDSTTGGFVYRLRGNPTINSAMIIEGDLTNYDLEYFIGTKQLHVPPHLYTNGQVKVYSESDVYPTTILNGQSTNNYEINGLNTSNNYTIRYEGECESINLANKSNAQGNNVLVKAGATSGNLTFVNDNGDIDNVLLVQNDVREQEINHFTGLQTVEVSRMLIENQRNMWSQDYIIDTTLTANYKRISKDYIKVVPNETLYCSTGRAWMDYSDIIQYNENKERVTSTQIFGWGTSGMYQDENNIYKNKVQLSEKTHYIRICMHTGMATTASVSRGDFLPPSTLAYNQYQGQYIDLPRPVQLNGLPDGTCDTYNPITGEYVQNVGVAIMDENGSYGNNWSNTGTAYPVSRCTGFTTGDMATRNSTVTNVLNNVHSANYGTAKDYEVKLCGYGDRNTNYRPVIDCGNLLTDGKNNINGLKAFLKENPIILYYQLVTPITTQLTPISISTFEGGILQLITTDGTVFPMIEYSMPTTNRYSTAMWNVGSPITHRNATEIYIDGSTTPTTPTETMTFTKEQLSSGSIVINDNGDGLMVLNGDYTGRDIPYFTGMRSVEAIEVETTPSPDQPLFGKGGRK